MKSVPLWERSRLGLSSLICKMGISSYTAGLLWRLQGMIVSTGLKEQPVEPGCKSQLPHELLQVIPPQGLAMMLYPRQNAGVRGKHVSACDSTSPRVLAKCHENLSSVLLWRLLAQSLAHNKGSASVKQHKTIHHQLALIHGCSANPTPYCPPPPDAVSAWARAMQWLRAKGWEHLEVGSVLTLSPWWVTLSKWTHLSEIVSPYLQWDNRIW